MNQNYIRKRNVCHNYFIRLRSFQLLYHEDCLLIMRTDSDHCCICYAIQVIYIVYSFLSTFPIISDFQSNCLSNLCPDYHCACIISSVLVYATFPLPQSRLNESNEFRIHYSISIWKFGKFFMVQNEKNLFVPRMKGNVCSESKKEM